MFGFFRSKPRKKPRRFQAQLEILEDRTVPATITITGPGRFLDGLPSGLTYIGNNRYTAPNLRSAIIGSENLAGPDTILLDTGTYTMNSNQGQFIVSDPLGGLTIANGSGGISTIDARSLSRIFMNLTQLSLSGLRLQNGLASNTGGAIINDGTLNISNCQYFNNEALGDIAGSPAEGGAIFNNVNSVLNVQYSTFSNNSAQGGTSSILYGGTANAAGGAIYFAGGGVPLANSILDSTFYKNLAQGGNGVAFYNISAQGGFGAGGGIFAQAGNYDLNLVNDTVAYNFAQGGQGALADGGNASGGGIYLQNGGLGSFRLVNDTIVSNQALGGRGNGALTLNGIGSGGGLASNFLMIPAPKVLNTIIAKNAANGDSDVDGVFSSLGSNLIGDNTGAASSFNAATGDFTGTTQKPRDPGLDALANYGGPTQTFRPTVGSFVVDRGNDIVVTGPLNLTTDQRGLPRRSGSAVDIGSFEAVQSGQSKTYSMVQGTTLTTTPTTYLLAGFTNPLGKNITVQLVPGKGPAVGKLTLNANGTFTYTPPANYFGTVSFEFEILINGQVTDVFTATINVTRKLGKK